MRVGLEEWTIAGRINLTPCSCLRILPELRKEAIRFWYVQGREVTQDGEPLFGGDRP